MAALFPFKGTMSIWTLGPKIGTFVHIDHKCADLSIGHEAARRVGLIHVM